jgi:hypothetical protein
MQQSCYHRHETTGSVFLLRTVSPAWTCGRCFRPLTFDACEALGLDGTLRTGVAR